MSQRQDWYFEIANPEIVSGSTDFDKTCPPNDYHGGVAEQRIALRTSDCAIIACPHMESRSTGIVAGRSGSAIPGCEILRSEEKSEAANVLPAAQYCDMSAGCCHPECMASALDVHRTWDSHVPNCRRSALFIGERMLGKAHVLSRIRCRDAMPCGIISIITASRQSRDGVDRRGFEARALLAESGVCPSGHETGMPSSMILSWLSAEKQQLLRAVSSPQYLSHANERESRGFIDELKPLSTDIGVLSGQYRPKLSIIYVTVLITSETFSPIVTVQALTQAIASVIGHVILANGLGATVDILGFIA
ncbi:hypothetical protein Tco_0657240 [Tanacetum coccineum]|uniref:Uncharacterized protein n=1 Tax=Tanacetum coccineum TaxID=301880 RepID=A0ABQ4XB10_9ASTR